MTMTRNPMSEASKRDQRGISLVLGLIMLVLMTLLAMSAFQASNVNLRIAGHGTPETLAAARPLGHVLSSPAIDRRLLLR
jgi:Tfp pilus assembly protein PilX